MKKRDNIMKNDKVKSLVESNLYNFTLGEEYGQRAVGDKIEAECANIFKNLYPNKYVDPSSKRSTDDFSLEYDNHKKLLDVKSHWIQEDENGFSMPNLISIKKLRKLLEDNTKCLSYIFVDYVRRGDDVIIGDVHVPYIWELDWSILHIQNLGWGQLQIKDANKELAFTDMGKEKWLQKFKLEAKKYYEKHLTKIEKELKNWE
jgi:hypothetical protein